MMNPNDEKFPESSIGKDVGSSLPPRPETVMAAEESELDSPAGRVTRSDDVWAEGRSRLTQARDRTQLLLRENPVPAILGALTLGLAIGWALRHATADEEKEIEVKSPIGNVDWSFFSLPFLWPFLRSVKDRYDTSAESVKDGVSKLKNIDIRPYTKPIRKRWKAWRD